MPRYIIITLSGGKRPQTDKGKAGNIPARPAKHKEE